MNDDVRKYIYTTLIIFVVGSGRVDQLSICQCLWIYINLQAGAVSGRAYADPNSSACHNARHENRQQWRRCCFGSVPCSCC